MTKNRVLALLLLFSCGGYGSLTNALSVRCSSLVVGARSSFAKRQTGASTTSGCSSITHHRPLAAVPIEVIDPSYNLALGSLALGGIFVLPGSPLKSTLSSILGGIPLTLFGLFLAFQTTTLRFTLDDTNFSLVRSNGESTGENVVVGGENVWAYNKFVNYDVFPSRSFPILIYFKETQTPEDNWNIGPGEQANSPDAIAKGAVPGQVHFFPAIGNTDDIIDGFQNHGCAKLGSTVL